jgi:hypothetical protein
MHRWSHAQVRSLGGTDLYLIARIQRCAYVHRWVDVHRICCLMGGKILYNRSVNNEFAAFTYFKIRPTFNTLIFKTHLIYNEKVGLIINTLP